MGDHACVPERRVPDGYALRLLEQTDFAKGFVPLLHQLTDVGALSEDRFREVFEQRERQAGVYRTVVLEHVESRQIVATASLIIELKFVHGGAPVGHVEDVVVDSSHRGKGLAKVVLVALHEEARKAGCYKVILDCKEDNCGLYEKCGYRRCEHQMRLDLQ
eukprot:TRINITY_DN65755_c0_g1_i1.p2 TRINITY_DN65755_c0_g1~~TRINITY_DN65755_c0_g1_i1.p2  ORF type:complete len:161 (-),score=27.86 TRINITY_DN65755_c0_g1_i1:114-596(-)